MNENVAAFVLAVSIHALARRATEPLYHHNRLQLSFNSRPRAEGDHLSMSSGATKEFQFTPSRGGRPTASASVKLALSFNSRPRAEGDCRLNRHHDILKSFNSRPRAEGDTLWRYDQRYLLCFNSRPRAEGDPKGANNNEQTKCFNSRPRAEGDGVQRRRRRVPMSFNSRPRAEGDRIGDYTFTLLNWFQFTPSRGGRHINILAQRIHYVSIHALARRATSSL